MTMNGSHPTNYLETLKKKKIAVVGLGRSGFATANFLLKNNISLFISDSRQDIDRHALEFIERNKIDHEIGENSDKILDSQLILISPGVPRDLPVIKKALNDGIDVINDIELLYRVLPQKKIVAVTGSNGKTTATALIGEIFNSYCSTWVGGNIGKP
ncbi:MAG TPA: UDP-N-acetylmuramoyl-L-alanine--D-glutamate ligase, partial [Bacteroidetes bacterium]|nr:UDP-N-acetylmuramoyl-L-alanine--D-glutamate ligase [Bacteroidota bacterium]